MPAQEPVKPPRGSKEEMAARMLETLKTIDVTTLRDTPEGFKVTTKSTDSMNLDRPTPFHEHNILHGILPKLGPNTGGKRYG